MGLKRCRTSKDKTWDNVSQRSNNNIKKDVFKT